MSYSPPADLSKRAFVILGAGTLGRRIALMWLTRPDTTVHLYDPRQETLEDAKKYIEDNLSSVITKCVRGGAPGTLKVFNNQAEALQNAWCVTEAIPEIRQAKIDLLGQLDAQLPTDVIIATNSSSFMASEISEMASEISEKVKHTFRIVNTHYYMPPVSLPVEIMPCDQTDERIAPLLVDENRRHGLYPFWAKKQSIGLIANRIWAAIKRESLLVAAEGVSTPAEIDALVGLALNVRPFQAMDSVGLDIVRDIEQHYLDARPDITRPEAVEYLNQYINKGLLGKKSGEGFFKHPKAAPFEQDHLIALDLVHGTVFAVTTDGTQTKNLVEGIKELPDGVQLDASAGKIYWSNMGKNPRANDGSIMSADIDGTNVQTLVAPGQTHTPKQLHLEVDTQTLFWCDREGGKLMSCKTDGSDLTTIYDSAPGKPRPLEDLTDWCVGITVDANRDLLYWTQKGPSKGYKGRIFRMTMSGRDIETLFDNLPEPIDLTLDYQTQTLYWTDRGDPPYGNTLNHASVSSSFDKTKAPQTASRSLVLADHFHEAIGLAADFENGKMYVADLMASIWCVDLDSKTKTPVVADRGYFTGVIFQKGKKTSWP